MKIKTLIENGTQSASSLNTWTLGNEELIEKLKQQQQLMTFTFSSRNKGKIGNDNW